MINIVFITSYDNYSRKLINYISSHAIDIKFYNICTSIEETKEIFASDIPNIILLDIDSRPKCCIHYLNNLIDNKGEKYMNSVLFLSNTKYHSINVGNKILNINCTLKSSAFKNILDDIYKIYHKNNIDNKIKFILKYLHFNFSYLGTIYCYEAIKYLCNCSNPYTISLEKFVYSKIAIKYNKTINNIKCNIINSVNLMFYDCDEKILIDFFNGDFGKKTTPKKVIYKIMEKINPPSNKSTIG